MKRLHPDDQLPCSLHEIQKQTRIVNEWKRKVEETEKLLAEYNAVAAKEGFLLAQMMSNATGLDEESKQTKAKTPKIQATSPALQLDTQKRRNKADDSLTLAPSSSAPTIHVLKAAEAIGVSGSNETVDQLASRNRGSAISKLPAKPPPTKVSSTESAPPQFFSSAFLSVPTHPDALVLSLSPSVPNHPQYPLVAASYRSGPVKFFQIERNNGKPSGLKEIRELKGTGRSSIIAMDWHRSGKVALLADAFNEGEVPFTAVEPLALQNKNATFRDACYEDFSYDPAKEHVYAKIKYLSSNKLVTAGSELLLWKLDDARRQATSASIHTSHSKRVESLCIGSDHMLYSGAQDCKLCTYSFTASQVVAEFPFASPVIALSENPTANDLLLVTLQQAQDQLHVIDKRAAATPVAIFSISGVPLPHFSPAWSPDGYLIAAGADETAHLFDLRNPKLVRKYPLDGQNGLFEFYHSGNKGSDPVLVNLGTEGKLWMHYLNMI